MVIIILFRFSELYVQSIIRFSTTTSKGCYKLARKYADN